MGRESLGLKTSQVASTGKVKNKRKILLGLGALTLLLTIYPCFVLIYTWSCVFQSNLEGGRHGPLDAYRHALASAVVSHTLGEWAVNLMTNLMESAGKDSNNMDTHNNRLGSHIGASAKSFAVLEPSVRQFIANGAVNSTDTNQITWLPKEKWRTARMW
jgi:hypothetical protein